MAGRDIYFITFMGPSVVCTTAYLRPPPTSLQPIICSLFGRRTPSGARLTPRPRLYYCTSMYMCVCVCIMYRERYACAGYVERPRVQRARLDVFARSRPRQVQRVTSNTHTPAARRLVGCTVHIMCNNTYFCPQSHCAQCYCHE